MIRIAAVDDEMHVLERFERMVLEVKEVELCGLFESGEQLLCYLKEYPLDAVFLDIEMPGINGIELSEQILDLLIEPPSTERYAWWCERSLNKIIIQLLLDLGLVFYYRNNRVNKR